jgi:hypothetical protein
VRKPGPRRKPAGVIRESEAYTKEQFLERVGWQGAAFAAAKANGLKTAKAGGRVFILGRWFHEYLEGLVY